MNNHLHEKEGWTTEAYRVTPEPQCKICKTSTTINIYSTGLLIQARRNIWAPFGFRAQVHLQPLYPVLLHPLGNVCSTNRLHPSFAYSSKLEMYKPHV